jgi:hypothetical protein
LRAIFVSNPFFLFPSHAALVLSLERIAARHRAPAARGREPCPNPIPSRALNRYPRALAAPPPRTRLSATRHTARKPLTPCSTTTYDKPRPRKSRQLCSFLTHFCKALAESRSTHTRSHPTLHNSRRFSAFRPPPDPSRPFRRPVSPPIWPCARLPDRWKPAKRAVDPSLAQLFAPDSRPAPSNQVATSSSS